MPYFLLYFSRHSVILPLQNAIQTALSFYICLRFDRHSSPSHVFILTHLNEKILVIGATGQIGSELTMKLRSIYGNDAVVCGYIKGAEPQGVLLESGPAAICDVTDAACLDAVVKKYQIDAMFNLAALLSVVAEGKPQLAWKIGVDGLWNVLEVARQNGCSVFTPSSIACFGPETPADNTPQDTIQRPRSIYGVTKVTTELLSDYYFRKYGVDTRSVRFPGLISYVILPEVDSQQTMQ